MESTRVQALPAANGPAQQESERCGIRSEFRMPLNYPRYTKADYEAMPEWKLDCLFAEYGLPVTGTLAQKRSSAMDAFLWTTSY